MKWEYQFIDIGEQLFKPVMDRQGEAGWELVSACHWKTLQGDWQVKLTMKRPALPQAYRVDPAGGPPIAIAEADVEALKQRVRSDLRPESWVALPPDGPATTSGNMPCEVFKPVEAVRVVHDYDPFGRR